MTSVYTKEEVLQHRKRSDLWIILGSKVYDVTAFLEEHPGGEEILLEQAGIDATNAFEDVGHSDEARALLKDYYIGDLVETKDPSMSQPPVKKRPAYQPVLLTVGCVIAVGAVAYHYIKGHQ